MASMIIGMVFVGVLMSMGISTDANAAASDLTTAITLAQHIREMTMSLPFSDPDVGDVGKAPGPDGSGPDTLVDDMDDLLGHIYSPPRSAMPVTQDSPNRLGQLLSEYTGWRQEIAITYRNPDDLADITYPGGINVPTDLAMVQCSIYKGTELIYVTEWLIVRPQGGWGP
jgi:hypothetical protein